MKKTNAEIKQKAESRKLSVQDQIKAKTDAIILPAAKQIIDSQATGKPGNEPNPASAGRVTIPLEPYKAIMDFVSGKRVKLPKMPKFTKAEKAEHARKGEFEYATVVLYEIASVLLLLEQSEVLTGSTGDAEDFDQLRNTVSFLTGPIVKNARIVHEFAMNM